MVRTLLLSSSSSTSSSSATTTARHSSDSHSSFSTDGCDSSRPSSVTDDDHHLQTKLFASNISSSYTNTNPNLNHNHNHYKKGANKYFSLSRFSSVFRKETKMSSSTTTTITTTSTTTTTTSTTTVDPDININIISGSSVKRMSLTAKEMFRKYLKKAKPLYEKLSQKTVPSVAAVKTALATDGTRKENEVISHSFSGNLRYPRRRSCVSSCPSSMRSSPSHSGILCRNSVVRGGGGGGGIYSSNSSSMEELQSAIQGAIAHCKNSMTQSK